MQTVLSIDTSQSPAVGILAEIHDGAVRIIERKEIPLGADAGFSQILNSTEVPEPVTSIPETPIDFSASSTSAIVILPPLDYISTVLTLPFDDPKQLSRVVPSELQDLVPFDTNEFVLQYRVVGKRTDGNFNVHVAAIPKRIVRNALSALQSRGIDPIVITTPESILQAVATLSEEMDGAVLYCYVSEQYAHLALCIDGMITFDRAVDRHAPYTNGSHGGAGSIESLLYRIRLEISAAERKAERLLDKIVFVDAAIDAELIQKTVGRPVELRNSYQVMEGASASNGLAMLGAFLAEDSRSPNVLTNFRVNEFTFRPPLKELLGAIRVLAPYMGLALGLALAYFVGNYLLKEGEIRAINAAVANQIAAHAPGLMLTPGAELRSLTLEMNKLEDELKDLGSPESYSPLEGFAQISSAMPVIPEVTVDKIDIIGNKLALEGCAPNYGAIETIENALNRNDAFASVKKQSLSNCAGGRPNGRGFKFEVWIRE
jgi:hypothetical protein